MRFRDFRNTLYVWIRSRTTWLAMARPMAGGTKAVLPGMLRRGWAPGSSSSVPLASTGGSGDQATFSRGTPRLRSYRRITRASGQPEVS